VNELTALRRASGHLHPERTARALARTFSEWRRAGSPWRTRLLERQRIFSPRALDRALELGLSAWSERALREWVARERPADACAPQLTAVWVAGPIPSNAFALVCAPLLAGSAVYARAPSIDPYSLPLFAQALAEQDPEVAAALALGHDDAVLAHADAVIAEGRDETLAALRARVPAAHAFVGYGHKLSLAAVGRGIDLPGAARAVALDTALYDGRGCLSPACIAVEDVPRGRAESFAASLAAELERMERDLPRGALDAAEHLAVRELRARWASREGARAWVSRGGTHWGVVALPESDSPPIGGSLRNVPVVAVRDASGLARFCAGFEPHLSTLAHAGFGADAARLVQIALRAGASRLCPLGRMQLPPIGWRHDGRGAIATLLRFIDVEPAGEAPQ
jgi:hypothetical protein